MPAVMWFRRDLRLSENLALLVDGDLASNQHGWQWTAVPELRVADDPHEPVDPIVDHAEERREALDRYERIKR